MAVLVFYHKIATWFGGPNVRFFVVLRGIVGGLGFCCYFMAISILPLGDAITLLSLYPVVTVIVARFAIKEAIGPMKALAILLTTLGAILIAQPTFIFPQNDAGSKSDMLWLGYICAFIGSCAGGALFVIMRVAKNAHTLQLIWSWAVGSAFFSGLLTICIPESPPFVMPTSQGWLYTLSMCIVGSLGHFLMNYGSESKLPILPSTLNLNRTPSLILTPTPT